MRKLCAKLGWLGFEWIVFGFALIAALQLSAWVGVWGQGLFVVSARTEELLYDLCVGYLVSYGFYILIVLLPESRQNSQRRSWLRGQYIELKLNLIRIYLSALGGDWETELPNRLLEPDAFREYFDQRHSPNQTRWHAVHNGLYNYGLPQIIMECQLFVREMQLVLVQSKFENVEAIDYLNNLSRTFSRMSILEPEYDDIKQLMIQLHQLHAPWSLIEGVPKQDKITEIIESV